jgi:peptide/nickel transport system permease protein
LPALTLAHAFTAVLTRSLRSALIDVQTTTYVDFARAKGLARRAVLTRHVLRAALLPIVTLVGVRLSYAIGGSVVVETVFALPGLGSWMVESIFARDYMVVQTLTLAFAFGAMLINLLTDLVYPLFDPRVRVG